jgi:hypothetical protein
MHPTARLSALLFSGLDVLVTTLTASASPLQPVTPPTPMPAFQLPGLNGSSGSDTDLRNKVTVIRFWASW